MSFGDSLMLKHQKRNTLFLDMLYKIRIDQMDDNSEMLLKTRFRNNVYQIMLKFQSTLTTC